MMSVAILMSYRLGNSRIASRGSSGGEVMSYRLFVLLSQVSLVMARYIDLCNVRALLFSLYPSATASSSLFNLHPAIQYRFPFFSSGVNLPLHLRNMKLSTITATLALLTTSALAAPTARQFEAHITFHGATPDDTWIQPVPVDGTTFYICESTTPPPFLTLSPLPPLFYASTPPFTSFPCRLSPVITTLSSLRHIRHPTSRTV